MSALPTGCMNQSGVSGLPTGVLTKDELYEELSLGGGVAGLVEQYPAGFVRLEAELDPPSVPALQP